VSTYDSHSALEIARLLDLPGVQIFERVGSTQDVAHALAEDGAPAGTLVIADAQTAGRGRGTNVWRSEPGAGIWFTLIERPHDASAVGVLSLRLALAMAPVLDRWTSMPVTIKWPNDLLVGDRKLAGILTEARWRGDRLEWVAIGVGINVRVPEGLDAAALQGVDDRVVVLGELIPAMRAAAAKHGELTEPELSRYAARDGVRGRRCVEPVAGIVGGVTPDGALIIHTTEGKQTVRSGSLVLEASS
jgi:BirA family biotin operon repressor/biotin-[acetyl-CoA-carboxylase] ligase